MKRKFFVVLVCFLPFTMSARSVVRINQLGYMPSACKVAVFLSDESVLLERFYVVNSLTGDEMYEGIPEQCDAQDWGKRSSYRLNFSDFGTKGGYYIRAGDAVSPSFRIGWDIYAGTVNFILNYMRQQRCGFNPFLKDSCHTDDGIIVDHPDRTGQRIDVTGGWHDASDYLQYVATSANAVYQMLFAYRRNPSVLNDPHGLNGCIILIHPGTDSKRMDKFYNRLDELLAFLKEKGYHAAKF